MLNQNEVFAAIASSMANGRGGAGGLAVMAVRVRGLGQLAVRFGYARGAAAEAAVAGLIKSSLRPADVVMRTGDETFAVVLPGLRNRNQVLLAVTRLVSAFEPAQVFADDIPPWSARVAMGVAVCPQDADAAETLWRYAQMAMDDAASRGEHYAFYDIRDSQSPVNYQDLRNSIDANRLEAWFQPLWNLQQGRMVGAESLARWTSQLRGAVPPDEFVPFAEKNDLIFALTRWSIHATLRYAGAFGDMQDFLLAINFSPRVLAHPGLVELLLDALGIWGVPPTSVIVEVTETALAGNLDLASEVLRRLRDQGLRVAIDDFGTGFSSITYLSRFPASELKIDKSLVVRMCRDARMAKLVESIIALAHNLDLTATAEGIEDAATQRMLIAMGCDLGQGFHLGKPEPAAEFIARFMQAAGD